MPDPTIKIVVEAQNLTKEAFQQVSRDAAQMGHEICAASIEIKSRIGEAAKETGKATEGISLNMQDLAIKISGVVTSTIALYSMYERIQNAEIALAAATKEVHESEVTLAEYKRRLNRLVEEGKTGTEEYNLIVQRIAVNEELLAVKEDRLTMAQQNVTKSYVYAAATVIPSVITAMASLKEVYTIITAVKWVETAATIKETIAEGAATAAKAVATIATWLLNKALAMKIALLTLGIGLAVATAAYMVWLASSTSDAAKAQEDYNRALGEMPEHGEASPSSGVTGEVPGFQSGGIVPYTGLFMLHSGEVVVPRERVLNRQSGVNVGPFVFQGLTIRCEDDLRSLRDEIQSASMEVVSQLRRRGVTV